MIMVPGRRLVAAAVLATLVGILTTAGCGSARPATPSPTAAPDTFPMTVTSRLLGSANPVTTVIPAVPRRIVSLDPGQLTDVSLALGAPLVGAGRLRGQWDASFADKVPGSVAPVDFSAPDVEQLAALHPDLIIASPGQITTTYPKLAAIAPTVAIPFPPYQPGATPQWQWYLEHVAQVEGRTAQVPAILDRLRAASDPLRARLRGWSAAVVQIGAPGKIQLCFGQTGQLLSSLGASIADTTRLQNCGQIGSEDLGSLDQANLIVLQRNPGRADLDTLAAQPLWPTLPAVRAGHVYLVPVYWGEAGPNAYLHTVADIPRVLTSLPPS